VTGGSRYGPYLRSRYRTVLGYVGLASLPVAGVLLAPLLLLPAYPQETFCFWGFFLPALALAGLGTLLWRWLLPRGGGTLTFPEAAVVILLVWSLAVLFGALPFWAVGGLDMHGALFEATSGWTTTGLTVLDPEQTPALLLFLRSLLQFAGGAGLAVLMLSSLTGPAGTGLNSAEGRADLLVPQVRRSARLVLGIYAGYALLGCAALRWAGMDWFDAVNHAFTALSTGGFSTRAASIGAWDDALIEGVVMALMLLGSLNFLTAWALLRRQLRPVLRNGELHLLLVLLPAAALLLLWTVAGLYPTLGRGLRVACFEAVSALTTSGFSITAYGRWPDLGWLVLLVLMMIGGGAGSTAGGLKQYRICLLLRAVRRELARLLRPRQTVREDAIWVGEERRFLSDGQFRQVGIFFFLYLLTLLLGTSVLCAYGHPLRESLFEFASALGTVGLSAGIITADAPAGLLWTGMAGMFFGRLEFLVIFVAVARLAGDLPALFSKAP
jgi:trk system potassium uptake protein